MKKNIFVLTIIVLMLFLPAVVHAQELETDNIREVMDIILDNYKGEVTKEELEEAAIRGMFSILDKNSRYYDKDSIVPAEDSLANYVGIGAKIVISESQIMIDDVVKGSPAEESGLKKGDKIILIDGIMQDNMSLNEVTALMKGQVNSKVELTVKRNGVEKQFSIMRKEIKAGNEAVGKVESLANGFKYIQIKNFNNGVYNAFSKILRQSERDGTKGLVIDLRDNKGGILSEVIKICQDIVPKGTIVSVVDKDGNEEKYYSYLEDKKFEITVLVNENSASASEILASAIKESGAGIVIGERTYGKGTVQKVFKDKKGNYLKITTGEYFTRNGNKIDGIGIKCQARYIDTY